MITSLLLSFCLYSPWVVVKICVCVPPSRNNCTAFIYVQAAEILAKEGISAEVKNEHRNPYDFILLVMDTLITSPLNLGYKFALNSATRQIDN